MDWATITTILGIVFSWDGVKYLLNRKSNARISDSEADASEFRVLQETVVFLQEQLKSKEERFAEQTERLRKSQEREFELLEKCGNLRLELQTYRCVRKHCGDRDPQNGY